MRWKLTITCVSIVLFSMLVFFPTDRFNEERIYLADYSLKIGINLPAKLFLASAVAAGSPKALNNLGVINYYSVGGRYASQNEDRISSLRAMNQLRDAALAGSELGMENLIFTLISGCFLTPGKGVTQVKENLQPLIDARNDSAWEFLTHCKAINLSVRNSKQTDAYCSMLAKYARRSEDTARMYFAAKICVGQAFHLRYHDRYAAAQVAAKGARLAFEAIENGDSDGYLFFKGLHRITFNKLIEGFNVGKRMATKTPLEWMLEGAEKGCWRCQCHAAKMTFEMLRRQSTYTAKTSDQAIGLAKACANSTEIPFNELWHRGAEYRVYHLRPYIYDSIRSDLIKHTQRDMRRFMEFEEENPGRRVSSKSDT